MARQVIAVTVALLLMANGATWAAVQQPAVGQKIDNYLNHNLPFLTLDYTCDFSMEEWKQTNPYGPPELEQWQSGCGSTLGVEFYDEMDAQEKIAADSNQQFTNLFGALGSAITSTAIGVVGQRLGARAAPTIATSTTGQVSSGVFGSIIEGITGWGSAAGSW